MYIRGKRGKRGTGKDMLYQSSAMHNQNVSNDCWYSRGYFTASFASFALFGKTPLIWAAEKGHREAVLALLNAGADKDAKNKVSANLI